MSVAFYRKYRSKKLSEVVGQNHITTVLERAIEQGKISHAYLFTGPRGVGKTSIARILAHEINNLPYNEEENHPDIIEIDAASNNSVEDIRDLRERIQMAPISAKFRVYVIDEVHMLSKSAFNALLKTLEEPPAHAVFILATTDAHKLPATIISRTQQFVFHFINKEDIIKHLGFIANSENLKISQEALEIIAERGGGSFRDSITLLDQISGISNEEITAEILEKILGIAPKRQILELIQNYETQNTGEILRQVQQIKNSGVDLRIFCEQFVSEIKNLLAQKPHLIKLLSPIQAAKTSNFIEEELLSTLILPGNFTLPPAQVSAPVFAPEAPKPQPAPQPKVEPQKAEIPKPARTPGPKPETPKTVEAPTPTEPASDQPASEFKWHDFLQAIKKTSPTIGGILSQSGYELTADTIKIYTGYKIKKTQLDKPQNRTAIAEALNEIGAGGWLIETFATNKPPESAEAAAVLEIMGGGEEIKVEGI